MSLLVFTQLDEMLFNPEEAARQSITEAIAPLQQQNIPLIAIGNKTRAETVEWMQQVGSNSPFVVEGGSGVFIPQSDRRFAISAVEQIDSYHLERLGCTYTEARAALKAVQEEISKVLRGFGDMDEEGIHSLINTSSAAAARRAKAREFSEYFLTPSRLEIAQLQKVAVEYGFKIIPGAKLSLILGGLANLVTAIERLKQNYSVNENNLRTVGLANSEADLSWLEKVDIPIVIPGDREVTADIKNKGWQIAEGTGLEAWTRAIAELDL